MLGIVPTPIKPRLTLSIHIYNNPSLCNHYNAALIATLFCGNDVMSDRWLSVEEIAVYLGVSKDTIYAWIAKRNLPAQRIGRFWKFKTDDVDEWVRSGGAAESNDQGKDS